VSAFRPRNSKTKQAGGAFLASYDFCRHPSRGDTTKQLLFFLKHELKTMSNSHVFKEQVSSVLSVGTYDPTPASGLVSRFKSQTANYNFAVYGAGIVGNNSLPLAVPIPAGSIITRIIVTNTLAFVGPATVGLGIVVANDLIATADPADAPWTLGSHVAALVAPLKATTVANPTGTRALILTFVTNAASAGNVTLTIEWLEPSTGSA